MMRRLIPCLCVLLMVLAAVAPADSRAQQRGDLPEEVQRELDKRGMTLQEARSRLRQLGIDPSNPQQAARRARQLDVPEARIQALLQVAKGRREDGQAPTRDARPMGRDTVGGPALAPANPPYPVLAGTPKIEPGSLSVGQLPVDVEVKVPLRSQNPMRRVQLGFLTAGGDSLLLESTSRIRRSCPGE